MREMIEKKIIGKINGISNGRNTVQEAGVNELLERLKPLDEASAQELQEKYIKVVKSLKN